MKTYQMVTGLVIIAVMTAFLGVLATPQEASAFGSIRSLWLETYVESDFNQAGCQLCHQNPGGGDGWNAYGWSIRQQIHDGGLGHVEAIRAVEALDADGNGVSNLDEINANFLPGWASGDTNTIYFKDGRTETGQTAPSGIGSLDPEQQTQWMLYLPIVTR